MIPRAPYSETRALSVIACAAALLGGCARHTYTPSSLPAVYCAEPAVAVDVNANLTRLASGYVSSGLIGPGDTVQVTIGSGYDADEPDVQLHRVAEDGLVQIPLIGAVQVAGLEPSQAERAIAELAIHRDVYRQPFVAVAIKEAKTTKVTIVGAVKSPGAYELGRDSSDVLSALAQAGGRTDKASTEIDVVHRSRATGQQGPALAANTLASYSGEPLPLETAQGSSNPAEPAKTRIDLAQIAEGGLPDMRLDDGDVVYVHAEGGRAVHVIGLVKRPTEIKIPAGQDLRLLDALTRAGGTSMAMADSVYVIRPVANQPDPLVIKVSIADAKSDGAANMLLADGDVVSVEQTPVTVMMAALDRIVRFTVSGRVPLF